MIKNIRKRLGSGREKKNNEFVWKEKNAELIDLINQGKVEEALDVGQAVVDYVDRTYRRDSREKATSYNNMGMAFLLNKDYELAEQCFREALDMRKRIFGDDHNEVAIVLLNLVQLYKAQAQEIFLANRLETEA